MTILSAPPAAQMFVELGVQLAPFAWVGVVVAVGACVAIVAATLNELRAGRRGSTYSLTPGRVDVRRVAAERSAGERFHEAA
jgi:hypothetical protein